MSRNENITLPRVSALPPMFEEVVERPERKRLAPADNEDHAAKPQKKKHSTAKQISSKILTENSNTDPNGLYIATPYTKWLQILFALHLFCSRSGVTSNPSTKSSFEDETHLATRKLSQLQSKTIEHGKQRNHMQCCKSQGGCIATNSQFPISQTLF